MALVKTDSRICFALEYYDDEAEAKAAGAKYFAAGYTYNGGFFHGMPCGRDKTFDHVTKDGVKLYAVSM